MLRVLGSEKRLCDGVSRRELMRVGGLSLFSGLNWSRTAQAAKAVGESRGPAKSVIMFNLLGGPSHIDMFDMKPEAALEIRGEFSPISTSVPGLSICEHLPKLSQWMHRGTLIRTFSHMFNSHDPLPFMTGFTDGNPAAQAMPTDPPDIGAICQYLGLGPSDLPGAVCMPCFPGSGQKGHRRRGPYGGFLGKQYDPLFTLCKPTFAREPKFNDYDPVMPLGEPFPPTADSLQDMTVERLDRRRSLVSQIDVEFASRQSSRAVDSMSDAQRRAFLLLTSGRTRDAFDLNLEPAEIREAYGRNLVGASLLMARRLVESGVPFVSVHQEIFDHYGHAYDMHSNNFGMLKNLNLPLLDQVIPALLQDLDSRGLLDSTLVVVMGEMGRSPKVNAAAGRDHWPQCGFSLLFGGGVKQGLVYGSTDAIGAYPTSNRVSPADFVATIYQLMGIDPHQTVPDRSGRPILIAHGGEPVVDIIG
ncbi:MAG: DUF1501 domain-containing protein [Planctomycetota bacterium]|nr:DUF1501 domain-containing protein [Planctomycetota bacterium]